MAKHKPAPAGRGHPGGGAGEAVSLPGEFQVPWPLAITLEAGVPLMIARLSRLPAEQIQRIASRASEEIASHADVILHRSRQPGETAAAVNWLIKGLAAAAHAPGGVHFGQLSWCAAHPASRRAPGDRACPACLTAQAQPAEPAGP